MIILAVPISYTSVHVLFSLLINVHVKRLNSCNVLIMSNTVFYDQTVCLRL